MKKMILFAVLALVAVSAMAQEPSWIGNSYIYHVEGDDWYNGSGTGNGTLGDFGIVTSLTLGGEAQTYQPNFGTDVYMGWNVAGGNSGELQLAWYKNENNNDWWQNLTGVNVAAGLAAGDYTVDVWFIGERPDNSRIYDNNGGNDYSADFTVAAIPEPATMSLLGLGALAMVLRRKMSK